MDKTSLASAPADPSSRAGDGRNAAEFARAERHSRRVRRLKIALPIIATLIVAGGVALTWIARSLPDGVSIASTTLESGQISMSDPRMSGVDSSGRPYELVARRAVQSLTGDTDVRLDEISAEIAISEGETAHIRAAEGIYDTEAETLALSGGITVKTSDGIDADLSSARIDMRSGSLRGEGAVNITMPDRSVSASSLEVLERGRIIRFGGRVKIEIQPSQEPERQALRNR